MAMKPGKRIRLDISMPARRVLGGVPATLLLGLLAAPEAQAECKPGGPINSNVGVVCEGGIDFYGVSAKSGATHITVEVKDDGSIDTTHTGIQLGGGSNVSVQGNVWSSNNHAISAVGSGGQDIAVGSFAELRARNYGILATGQGPLGNVHINNGGTIRGLLNQGGIYASTASTEDTRVSVSNAGLIEVGGTGGGIRAVGFVNNTVSVTNSGHIIAASHALRAQGQEVTLRNTGAIDIVRNNGGYGIYGEATFTTAKRAEVTVFNDAAISFSAASGYGVGIWAQASVSTPDPFDNDNRGIAKVTNHGSITGLGGAAGGIHASGKDEAEIVNRGAISMSGAGAGLRAESGVKALIDNNAAVGAHVGISMTAIGGTATLRNSGSVTGNTTDAVNVNARIIDVDNSGDLRAGLVSGLGIGLNLVGQFRTTVVNSGDISGPVSAIQASATGGGGQVSVSNTGKLLSPDKGIDVLGDAGAKVDNAGAISTTGIAAVGRNGIAVLARSHDGAVEVLNTGDLTLSGAYTGYAITSQVLGTRGSVLIDNSGRLLGGGGISAVMQTVGGAHSVEGDVTVRNSGEMFVRNGVWGVSIQARNGLATIDNQARIDSDGGGFFVQAAQAVIDNRGALDIDGRSEAISVHANGKTDSFAQLVNSGAILLNEKSGYTRAVYINVINEPGTREWGRAEFTNRAEIVSLGTSNAGVVLTGTRANVVVDNSKAVRVQGVAIDTRSNDGNISVTNTGALSTTLQHGVSASVTGAGDILIDNRAAVTAQVGGLYASAAQGVAEVVNSGAISVGTAVGITAGGIQARGARAAIMNHGDITMSSAGSALIGVSSSSDSDVRITNHGAIDMGNSGSAAIYASAGFGGGDDRSGFVHVNNHGDITGGRGAGIDAFAELAVVLTNNRLIETGGASAILMRSRDNALGSLLNDRNGQIINHSAYAATVRAWGEQDIVINAGVITNRSTSTGAKAVDLGGGSDVMELERGSKIVGVVDGGSGSDTLRWAGVAGAAAPGRFEMSTVGTQYINFERFVKAGSSTWVFEGAGNGIDLLEVAEGTARVDGVLDGDVTVRAGAVLGGNGRIDGRLLVEGGGHYAPGASIGSQVLQSLVLDDGAVFQLELHAGGLFDSVTVLGNAQLGGILDIHFLDATGFEAGWQASFLQAASVTGAFSGYRVSGLDGTARFDVVVGTGGVDIVLADIQISPVPEPAAGWMFALGLTGLGLARRAHRRR